ncbi:hypothetical protein QO058_07865 [Bosea vestrisii]|uniref:hypothetical protein n=1 Tax=Bosea vestrisii TaxID=151416 RepID=UPI0024DFE488|nr:hypothetical protein [Bosea vestrisii]WID98147.1 hypothetical protein QO058_07865 [Bosea vestrisii]
MNGVGKGAGAAAAPADPVRKAPWVTRPDVEFLNSLHPRGGVEFPQMDEFIGDHRELQDAFKIGFRAVKDRWEAKMPEAIRDLSKYELKVYWAIKSRTLDFGKLFEKIPERHFRDGLCNDDGSLKIGDNDYPIFPPVGIPDHGNLGRTIKALLRKKAISRFESDKHPVHGMAHIYTPMNLMVLWNTLIRAARFAYIGANQSREQDEWKSFANVLRSRTRRLMDELDNEPRRPTAPSDAHRAVVAANDQGDGSKPQVRKRVRSLVRAAEG